jgi:hypothetical protein
MLFTIYFYCEDNAPVVRTWAFPPRVGDRVGLPEFGDLNPMTVRDVLWEGYEDPTITVHLQEAGVFRGHPSGLRS